jgi:hypothetical protein
MYCLLSLDFFRAAAFRCKTPFETALSKAEKALRSASKDSSFCLPCSIASTATRIRLRVNDRVERFRAALRFWPRRVLRLALMFLDDYSDATGTMLWIQNSARYEC